MDMKLELVPVPVSDVDSARDFYVGMLGFNEDHDTRFGENGRVMQLTPPGSACSIVIGTGLGEISEMRPGSIKALHLVVADVASARDALVARGIEVGQVVDHGRGVKMAHFSDPDGNTWALQEMSWRTDLREG